MWRRECEEVMWEAGIFVVAVRNPVSLLVYLLLIWLAMLNSPCHIEFLFHKAGVIAECISAARIHVNSRQSSQVLVE
jgi:hypothetical protein